MAEARKHLGQSYVWGATGPTTFDCSGLVKYSYGKFAYTTPRGVGGQAVSARLIPASRAVPGDLVFTHDTRATSTTSASTSARARQLAAIDPMRTASTTRQIDPEHDDEYRLFTQPSDRARLDSCPASSRRARRSYGLLAPRRVITEGDVIATDDRSSDASPAVLAGEDADDLQLNDQSVSWRGESRPSSTFGDLGLLELVERGLDLRLLLDRVEEPAHVLERRAAPSWFIRLGTGVPA